MAPTQSLTLGPAFRPVAVPEGLEESSLTKASGQVELPFHFRWTSATSWTLTHSSTFGMTSFSRQRFDEPGELGSSVAERSTSGANTLSGTNCGIVARIRRGGRFRLGGRWRTHR
jgi:hypothetical protein